MMTTVEARKQAPASLSRAWPLAHSWRIASSARVRLVGWWVVLLALSLSISILVERQVLLARVDDRLRQELLQERGELESLARGMDPARAEPFGGDVRRIFEVFMDRNIPSDREQILTFLNGELFRVSARTPRYPLESDPRILALGNLRGGAVEQRIDTPAGTVMLLATPIGTGRPGDDRGVFVVAQFAELERAELDVGLGAGAGVGLVTLLIATVLAWGVAGRVLAPIRQVTETARSISDSDLTQRITVRGTDEVAALAGTFNDMLDRLEIAFGEQRRFVDDAGHELRTPITIIRGHLELLGDSPEERRETVALVTDELDRMTRMVHDLLLLARAEQPDFLEPGPVDVQPLTKELHAKAAALGDRDWRLEATGSGTVIADRQRLTQAVMQLAQNATQHTQKGDVIALGSALSNGQARFWVRDAGPGVSPEDTDRIFGRFARGSGPRRSGGVGLGLSIVLAIAEAHRGTIKLRSRPGSGATFTIVIPTRQVSAREGAEQGRR